MLFAFLTPTTMIVLGILGVLIFGRRMPEVGRALGQTIIQFKKGMRGLEDDIDGGGGVFGNSSPTAAAPPAPVEQIRAPQRVAATAPKFEDTPASPNPPQV
jgi:sec-independent protein translocase protein TatA